MPSLQRCARGSSSVRAAGRQERERNADRSQCSQKSSFFVCVVCTERFRSRFDGCDRALPPGVAVSTERGEGKQTAPSSQPDPKKHRRCPAAHFVAQNCLSRRSMPLTPLAVAAAVPTARTIPLHISAVHPHASILPRAAQSWGHSMLGLEGTSKPPQPHPRPWAACPPPVQAARGLQSTPPPAPQLPFQLRGAAPSRSALAAAGEGITHGWDGGVSAARLWLFLNESWEGASPERLRPRMVCRDSWREGCAFGGAMGGGGCGVLGHPPRAGVSTWVGSPWKPSHGSFLHRGVIGALTASSCLSLPQGWGGSGWAQMVLLGRGTHWDVAHGCGMLSVGCLALRQHRPLQHLTPNLSSSEQPSASLGQALSSEPPGIPTRDLWRWKRGPPWGFCPHSHTSQQHSHPPSPHTMAYHSFLLEPISCHAWNKDRTRKY